MKPLLLAAALMLAAGPALAQNAAQIERARTGAACPKCNLFQADLGGLELRAPNFVGARLRQADFSLATIVGARLAGADLRDIDAYGAVLTGGDFSNADLTNASFVGAYLNRSSFAGAKLSGTNFSGADLSGARGLTSAQLVAACGDESTRLPAGLRISACR
ncbi:pentapeptide repeat-containing protein [Caulobacter sp. 17J65-9]|uniref:pentapeptide repeat-containing protein n=1 Tax=Caulobacter sp. 17J65-9 TaxID=2709382 RepID=UPI0013CDCBE6|nr:pentapeptide repeat-containing protein [Caulobacter sp. 17J65-9]NEX91339.1 pentapeptide repeat-containing protein [Caulobacter sp. 17J65-9]